MSAKLNEDKIRWILREVEKGELTRAYIAWAQKVTEARVSQLWRAYQATGEVPVLKPAGRPPSPIEAWEVHVVAQAYEDYRVGARLLEGRIEEDYGVRIGHNRVHRIMLQLGLSREERMKRRRRTWVRYERAHSNELWHTDWKRLSALDLWLIAYEDDASRYVVGYGTREEDPTTEASLAVLEAAIAAYGVPDAVLTDRGSTFYAPPPKGPSRYTRRLEALGIRHPVGRVNHPQTNGKVERLYRTVEERLTLFDGDLDALFAWYNGKKPHMSLSHDGRRYDTPREAFWYKMSPERLLGYSEGWFWEASP